MNRIVRENIRVTDLPETLRDGFSDDAMVRVTVETDVQPIVEHEILKRPDKVLTLKELLAMRRPPYKTTEQIVDEVRRMREEWGD